MEPPIPRPRPAWLVLLLLGIGAVLATTWVLSSLRPADSDPGLGLERPEAGMGTELPGPPLRHAASSSVERAAETRATSRDARRSAGTDAPELAQGIQGLVRDQLGNPVPGATVTIRTRLRGTLATTQGESASLEQRETTDAMGAFAIATLPTDDLELAVEHRDFATLRPVFPLRVYAGQFTELATIILSAGFTLSGIVRQTGSQAPVPDAVVEAVCEQINPLVARDETPRTTRTDAEGRFDVRGLHDSPHSLTISGVDGLAAVTIAAVEVPRQAPGPMIIDVPRAAVWSGRVFASDGRGAIEGATVSMHRREAEASPPRERQTDVRGEFRFADLEPVRYRVHVRKAGYQPFVLDDLDLVQVQHTLRFELMPRAAVDVTVTDATGRPAAAARVELVTFQRGDAGLPCRAGGATAVTDAQGRARLPGPEPAAYAVLVVADDHAPTLSPRFDYPGPADRQIAIKLDPGGAVTGVVRDGAGQPIAHAVVEIGKDSEATALAVAAQDPLHCTRTTRTGLDGTFRLAQLPTGVLAIRVRHPDFVVAAPGPVTVRSGGVTILDRIVLASGIKRSGMAFDDDGVPIRGGEVLAQRQRRGSEDLEERGIPTTVRSWTDQNGSFTLAGLIPGTYEISVARTEPGLALRQFMDHLRSRTVIDVSADDTIRLQLRRSRPDPSPK